MSKVSDFGLTVSTYGATHRTVQSDTIPVRYLPPEALKRNRYSEASDVWAFGVTAFELLSAGMIPCFEISNDNDVIAHVVGGGRLSRPAEASRVEYNELWGIVESCWAADAAARPTFAQLSVLLGQLPLAHIAIATAATAATATAAIAAGLPPAAHDLCEVHPREPKKLWCATCGRCICCDCTTPPHWIYSIKPCPLLFGERQAV